MKFYFRSFDASKKEVGEGMRKKKREKEGQGEISSAKSL